MNNNQLDNFEKFINESLSHQKAVYDPADWDKLNKRMNTESGKPFFKSYWFIAASILTGVAITYFSYNSPNKPETEIVSTESTLHQEKKSNTNTPVNKDEIIIEETTINDNKTELIEVTDNKETYNVNKIEKNSNNNISSETKELKEIEAIPSSNINSDNTSEEPGMNRFDSSSDNVIEENISIEQPNSNFYMNTNEGCEGISVVFRAEPQKNVDYLWKFDDGHFSKEMNPTHTFEKAGVYQVNLIVRSSIDNSIMKKSMDQVVVVLAKPKVDFEWEMLEENSIPYTSFINMTNQGNKWSWNFGDGTISNEKDPNHTYRNKGHYSVSLSVTNEENCSATINKEVAINEDYNLLAPNSFTPNGDGLNDVFMPAALNRLNGTFVMMIYSASEGLIYETKNVDQPWDGVNQKTGEKCKEGSYVWVVKLTNETGNIEQYKGAILLLK